MYYNLGRLADAPTPTIPWAFYEVINLLFELKYSRQGPTLPTPTNINHFKKQFSRFGFNVTKTQILLKQLTINQ